MKLTIGNQPVSIPFDASISLEKSSPALSENVGSFSYPFSIPRLPNQRILGWPGKLERVGDIPDQGFILEESGIQVLRGTMEYDTVTKESIGIILKSGATEFYSNVLDDNPQNDGSNLPDIDFGHEHWFGYLPVTIEAFNAKLTSWDQANRTPGAPFVVAPFRFSTASVVEIFGNKHSTSGFLTQTTWLEDKSDYFMLQFKAWYMIERIFQHYGYAITLNELKTSDFCNLVIFSRPFAVTATEVDLEAFPDAGLNDRMIFPWVDQLTYAHLMPQIKTVDFLSEIKTLMALSYNIDDLNKTVAIMQLKSMVNNSQEPQELTELSGWEHREIRQSASEGFSLKYAKQEDDLSTRSDYRLDQQVADYAHLGWAEWADQIYRVTGVERDFLSVMVGTHTEWREIGRLKPMVSGAQKTQIELNVQVPPNTYIKNNNTIFAPLTNVSFNPDLFKGPHLSFPAYGEAEYYEMGATLLLMSQIHVSLYRGAVTNSLITSVPFQIAPMPLLAADKWILSETIDLSPQGIYDSLYAEYLTWRGSGSARSFTKYVWLTLPELLSLSWGKRYVISGVRVILSKINYELPFAGVARIEGYTA